MKGKVTTILTACPVRVKPEDASEMVSQLLFGEKATVIGTYKKNWTQIKLDFDDYEGWIDTKQIISCPEIPPDNTSYCLEIFEKIFGDEKSTWISLGAELNDYDGMISRISSHTFRYSGHAVEQNVLSADGEIIEKLSRKLLNTPYLWGGRTPLGIDCSGFTQLIYKCVGLRIRRDSFEQALQGETVDFVSACLPGDLAFFTKSTEKISHVGIVLPDMKIIHASGCVRIDRLDHYGIFNDDIQEYTHRLKIIKRYF